LSDVTAGELRGMLLLRRAELEHQIASDSARLGRIEARLRAIEQEDDMPDDISLKTLPAQRVVAIARPAPGFGHDNLTPLLEAAFGALNQALKASGVQSHRLYFTFYTGGDPDAGTLIAYAAAPVSNEVRHVQEPAQILLLPEVPQAATTVREGTYAEIYTNSRVYVDLAKWLDAHGYVPAGAGRDVYIDDRDIGPDEPTVVEVQWPLRRPGDPVPDLAPRQLEGSGR
jgi:effector-binding domain-containing protein